MGWDGAYADDEGGEFDGGHGEKTRWFVEKRRCKLVLPVPSLPSTRVTTASDFAFSHHANRT